MVFGKYHLLWRNSDLYSVSEAYLTRMMSRGTRRRLSGTIGNIAFTGEDVILDSFSVSAQATTESDTKIGGVFLGQISLTFVPSFLSKVARDEFQNKELSVSIGLFIPSDGISEETWVDVPIGVYTLQAPKISKQGITVSGYDHMQRLDKKFEIDTATGSPYTFLNYIGLKCGVEIGNTQAEIEALPNGTELLPLSEQNDIETYRDFLYWLAQSCGCFACADRQGKIVLRQFGTSNSVEIDEMHRDIDVIFSGYTTKWTGISFVDTESQSTMYYSMPVDDGLTMNLGENPLLQTGSKVAVDRRRYAVLGAVANIQYTPFVCNSARDPIYDLGDEIHFTGGLSGNCTGCVMAYTYTLDSFSFEGYGDDPALANALSKSDKNISNLKKNTTENEVTFYNFANLQELSFESEQDEFIFDFLTDLAKDSSYEIRYYLDEELVTYKPYERLGTIDQLTEGDTTEVSVTRDFYYIIRNVEPNVRHTWRVRIITHNIELTTIQTEHAHVTIEGQRLYTDKAFDGYIEVADDLTIIPLGYLGLVSITDSVSITEFTSESEQASDNLAMYDIKSLEQLNLMDRCEVSLVGGFSIHAENGDQLVSESGDRIVTE